MTSLGDAPNTPPLEITGEFAEALDALHSGQNLFLTGKAGTGKSTLIRHFVKEAEAAGRNVITAAPTGIAALNVDGYTLHRLFSFPTGVSPETVLHADYFPHRFHSALRTLNTLIIDEVSMVRADLFDAITLALDKFGPTPGAPFGGVQVVLVGDLYQLPPVVSNDEIKHFVTRYRTPFFFSADTFNPKTFPTHSLTHIFRQETDDRLTHLLNSVREGVLLEGARDELNQRTDPNFEPPDDQFWLTLTTTNRIADARNRRALERLPTETLTFHGQITGDLDGFVLPAARALDLKVGAQVMLINNDPDDRWANGTLGVIEHIDTSGKEPVVWVRLRGGKLVDVTPYRWDITRPVVNGSTLDHKPVGGFTQLPMRLAWAVTIHKSQGQTLDRVFVDLSGGVFASGQLYVALSRCTSMDGLILKRGVKPADLKTDRRVAKFLDTQTAHRARGTVVISILTVGNEGFGFRPRPLELTLITDEGEEISTLINPTSDLYNADAEFGISNEDVALAPTLVDAWPALAPFLEGRIPVGVGIDRTLALLDAELKRGGVVVPMALGVDIPEDALTQGETRTQHAGSSLNRAMGAFDAAARYDLANVEVALSFGGTPFPPASDEVGTIGYTQSRGTPARSGHIVGSGKPQGSGRVFTVGGAAPPETLTGSKGQEMLAEMLRAAWDRAVNPSRETYERLRNTERDLGISILPKDAKERVAGGHAAEDLLFPGARVCFTGTVLLPNGRYVSRGELEDLALGAGLTISDNMTKTKTDVLVVAQQGTQSSKARHAHRWNKPVLTAQQFLDWLKTKDT